MSHDLFPIDPQVKSTQGDIDRIYITRNGVVCPTVYAAAELTSVAQLYELYGGGQYLLKARGRDNARWTASATWTLAGTPKPLTPASDTPPAPVAAAPSSGGVQEMMALMAAMMSPVMAMMSESMKANTTILAAVLGKRDAGLDTSTVLDFAKSALAQSQAMNPADPNKTMEAFMASFEMGLEFAKSAQPPQQQSGNDLETVLGGARQFFEMANATKARRRPLPGPPPAGPGPAAPQDQRARLVAEGRAFFGEVAAGASDEEVAARYAAHLERRRAGGAP